MTTTDPNPAAVEAPIALAGSATALPSASAGDRSASPPPPLGTGREADGAFVAHARTVAGLTLVSRVAGVARDAVCARVFGAGPLWSAFAFAFVVPNLFRRLFGEGALAAAFLPEYTRLMRRHPAQARRFAWLVVSVLGIGLAVLTLVAEIVLWWLEHRFGGPDAPARALVLRLTMLMLPYMPLVCLVAMLGAMLQVHHRFGPTAAAPVLLNACIIAAAAITALTVGGGSAADALANGDQPSGPPFLDDPIRVRGVYLVALAVLLAGVLQLAWSLLALRGTPGWPQADDRAQAAGPAAGDPDDEPRNRVRSMLKVMVPMLIGTGVLQINTLMDSIIAAYPVTIGDRIGGITYPLDQAANAILFYAQRLYQFPLGVFGIAIATAIFPALARTAENQAEFTNTLRRGLRLTAFIGLPASLGLMAVAQPLPAVLLQGGLFERQDVHRVAAVLFAYAPAIWAYSMIHVLTRAFYAHGDARTPLRIAISVVGLNIVLNMALIWPFREAGLAWSTAISATVNCAALLVCVRRHAPHPVDRSVVAGWGRTAAASAFMVLALLLAEFLWATTLEPWLQALTDGTAAVRAPVAEAGALGTTALSPNLDDASGATNRWWIDAARLGWLVMVGAGAYLAAARLLAMEELRWLMSRGA